MTEKNIKQDTGISNSYGSWLLQFTVIIFRNRKIILKNKVILSKISCPTVLHLIEWY